MILALDPGTVETAYFEWDGDRPGRFGFVPNAEIVQWIADNSYEEIACEMIASYGMPVGREVFETCVWIGEFRRQAAIQRTSFRMIYRKDVKMHLCMTNKAKDGNVRQALIDRFGAPGVKKKPGVTYGVSGHMWAAMAVAVYAWDNKFDESTRTLLDFTA